MEEKAFELDYEDWPLPSDSVWREDANVWKEGKEEEGQRRKEEMEDEQRKDRKRREEGRKRRKERMG